MTVISTKSITGVTSITSPQSDDAVTLHTNDTTQRVSVTTGGMNVTGVLTATSFSGTLDTAAQTNVTSVGTLTGLTVSGDVTFTGSSSNMLWRKANNALRLYDNVQLNFGNSDEGDIYRDSTQMIVNNANGNLKLRSNSIHIAGTSNEKHIVSNTGLGVTVYYNNSARLATTNSGVEVTGTGTFSGDVLIADKIVHTGDTNTAIRFADADTFTVETGGGERLRIVGVGSFGINNSDPKYTMHFKNAMTSSPSWIHMEVTGSNTVGGGGGIAFDTSASNNASNNSYFLATIKGIRNSADDGSNDLVFSTSTNGVSSSAPVEKLRITSGGIIKCGTSGVLKAEINNAVSGHQFISQCDDNETGFEVYQQHGSTATRNTFACYDNRGDSASKQQSFAVRGDGFVLMQATSSSGSSDDNIGFTHIVHGTSPYIRIRHQYSNSTGHTLFHMLGASGNLIGEIKQDGSGGVTYHSASDYRLKENIVDLTGAITRLKNLKPKRFNFKVNTDVTQDGFLAHELQEVVPIAVSGTKDEVVTDDSKSKIPTLADKDIGDPVYQTVDTSRVVPLLTAALQEAITKIETLETKVAALESS